MFEGALQQVFSSFRVAKRDKRNNGHKDIYGRVVEQGEDFFHPQKFRGIPVFDVQSILMHYKVQLDKIKQHVEIGDHRLTKDGTSLYDAIYTSVIERYVEFCHMIPASEDHHHSHTGGLLLHSLEASVDSLRWAKEKQTATSGFVDIDAQVKPVMNYCAWLAALLHDAGKMMSDMSVDAVEIYNPKTRLQGPVTEPIVSWHPAKESLIEWAKRNHIASYSVNFFSHRTHNRHNIDSSQIIQPLLRNQYAMEYLFSTPIKQEVYSALTSVLSGYSTSENFLSEAVRMGDSASTSRSLGYLYDTKLGNRTMSTAQRLYRSIRHAAKDWQWNARDSQGWIIGGEVYIRWTSTVEDIIKVSVALGYSLPADVKNVLNIMEENHITDLFDKKLVDDRVVRFTPGQFTRDELQDIQQGTKQVRWDDLLKLRGPEIIFAEAAMPFSKEGLVYLPVSGAFYIITKEGVLTKLAQIVDKTSSAHMENTEDAPSQQNTLPSATSKTKTQTKTKAKSKSNIDKIEVLPKANSNNTGLTGIEFVNGPKVNKSPLQNETKKDKSTLKAAPTDTPNTKTIRRCSDTLNLIIQSDPLYIISDEHAFIPTSEIDLPQVGKLSDVISKLEKSGEIEININNPTIKTVMHTVRDKKQKCIKLTQLASGHFDNQDTQPSNQTSDIPSVNKPSSKRKSKLDDQSSNTSVQTKAPSIEANTRSVYKNSQGKKLQFSDVINVSTAFVVEDDLYIDVDAAAVLTGIEVKDVAEYLSNKGYLVLGESQSPHDMISRVKINSQERDALLVTKSCAKQYLGSSTGSALRAPNQPSLLDDVLPTTENQDRQQLEYLVRVSSMDSLIHYLSNKQALDAITENGIDGFFFDHHVLSQSALKVVSKSRLKNYMRERGIHQEPKGYLLSADQLTKIRLSEVSYDE